MISTPENPFKNVKVWVAACNGKIDSLILSLMGSIYDFSKGVRIGESVT